MPVGSFASPKQLVGKTNRTKIVANEPVLEVAPRGRGGGFNNSAGTGKRALAVKVDEIIGVSGFIVPDDRVDVIVTTLPPGNNNQDNKMSKIVLQNKRVLSVAQNVEQKDGKPQVARSITSKCRLQKLKSYPWRRRKARSCSRCAPRVIMPKQKPRAVTSAIC